MAIGCAKADLSGIVQPNWRLECALKYERIQSMALHLHGLSYKMANRLSKVVWNVLPQTARQLTQQKSEVCQLPYMNIPFEIEVWYKSDRQEMEKFDC